MGNIETNTEIARNKITAARRYVVSGSKFRRNFMIVDQWEHKIIEKEMKKGSAEKLATELNQWCVSLFN